MFKKMQLLNMNTKQIEQTLNSGQFKNLEAKNLVLEIDSNVERFLCHNELPESCQLCVTFEVILAKELPLKVSNTFTKDVDVIHKLREQT